jgi:26S proteasome regulatory subunit N11
MLLNLHKTDWASGLQIKDYTVQDHDNKDAVERMVKLAEQYTTRVKEEKELTEDQLKTRYVGKQDPKKHLEETVNQRLEENIVSLLAGNIDKVSFK